MKNFACLCGSERLYFDCCKPYHDGMAALSADVLMRSRYSAYVLRLELYLLETWHATTRPSALTLTTEPQARWLGLQIKRHEQTGDASALVEFVARYKVAGRAYRLHEVSRFLREEARWYYLDGVFPDGKKPDEGA